VRRLFGLAAFLSSRLAARLFLDKFASPGRRRLEAIDESTLGRAQRRELAVGTEAITTYEWGPAGAPTLLILHGWGSHAPRFSAFIEAGLSRGWRIVAFDAPGHGHSTGKRSSLMQFRSALDAVVESCGPVHGFIAHSLGALALALRLADIETTAQPRAAVLISMPRDTVYLMELYLDALGAAPRVRAAVRRGFTRRYGLDIDELSGLTRAARITCPVLVVHDESDESVPVEHGYALQKALPRGALLVTRGLGHNRLLRDPATVDAVMTFLATAIEEAQ
jgi:pimeloyl-ACP methyl ester carboxylesterase